jgi:GDPmannose 4,6-dehydratase
VDAASAGAAADGGDYVTRPSGLGRPATDGAGSRIYWPASARSTLSDRNEMGKRVAFVTGITGQDGSYLAELLLQKDYIVHGLKRRSSLFNTERIDRIFQDPHRPDVNLFLHHGDLTDSGNVIRLLQEIRPDEIYNLGAQSHVAVSFQVPEYTADVNAMGALRLLEGVRALGMEKTTRFYQASTSELFGGLGTGMQNEATPFHPRSPYAVAKLFAHWTTVNYREAYGMYACNGILFNHESPRRGETFVTRKITRGLARVALGIDPCLYLGNLEAVRDWGHARDYVQMQWLMLQQAQPEDFVIATGRRASVREFVVRVAARLGLTLEFEGSGTGEIGRITAIEGDMAPGANVGQVALRIDPRYLRPAEVDRLVGDAARAREKLGWQPVATLDDLVDEMVSHDHDLARRWLTLNSAGFDMTGSHRESD